MSKNKMSARMYLLAAICSWAAALAGLFGESKSISIVFLCVGFLWMGLSAVYRRKYKSEQNESKNED